MCGIYGKLHRDSQSLDLQALKWATDRLKHRGPDDEGYLLVDLESHTALSCGGTDTDEELGLPPLESFMGQSYQLGFGFRRLSILDLSPGGHQPMSVDGRYWIVYNGEIYNYLELRQELSTLGYTFHTATDTEVILAAYQHWGQNCLQRFNGMWALAIWDMKTRTLFLARDRFGIKPLYYTNAGEAFTFGSEIKALVGEHGIKFQPEAGAIFNYLAAGKLPLAREGNTFFKNVHALPPGHAMEVSQKGTKLYAYWSLESQNISKNELSSTLLEEYRGLFEDSIRLRLRSDVPIGTCLSGGLDSSSIVCIINNQMVQRGLSLQQIGNQQRTFSAVYEENSPFNEHRYISMVLSQTHAEANFTWPSAERLSQEMQDMIWHQDEPFPSTSIFSQWCVMSKVKERGVTVLLDGQGADELLGGYRPFHRYLADLIREWRLIEATQQTRYINLNSDVSGLRSFVLAGNHLLPKPLYRWSAHLENSLRANLSALTSDFKRQWRGKAGNSHRTPVRSLDEHLREIFENSNLPDLLRYEDRNSMAFSIEARVPFLDYRFVQYHFGPAAPWRIYNGWSKYILRRAMQNWVPEEIIWRKDKVAFATPEESWLRHWLSQDQLIFNEDWLSGEYLSLPEVKIRLQDWLNGNKRMPPVWRWINLELWLRAWCGD